MLSGERACRSRMALWLGVLMVALPAIANAQRCPDGVRVRLDLPVTRAALAHDRAITVVALGSSSTEGAGASAPDRTYPAQLEALLRANWPDAPVTVLNRGIGGQTVDAVVPRIGTDVVDAHPTLVVWQVGTNEALRGTDPATFARLLDEGLRQLTSIGADVVLMDYQLAPRMPAEAITGVYGEIIAKEAKAHEVPLFSRAALMRSWQASDPAANDMIGPDGLHHTDRGYACVAAALDSAIVVGSAPTVAAAAPGRK
jgi:lysophospholipase L1-like esterase